jgi:maleylpyruvate isomerase
MRLHDYFRSSSAYRVRIVLNLKGLGVERVFHHLRRGEQRLTIYRALNPQGLLPTLETADGTPLTQSLAICEYLDELQPDPPLLPEGAIERAKVRAFALAIACDIHPLQNLRVLDRLRSLGSTDAQTKDWARAIIDDGLAACNALVERETGPFCFGAAVTLADCVLVPQLANARRFEVDLRWPRLTEIEARCMALEAFAAAAPARQPDAE